MDVCVCVSTGGCLIIMQAHMLPSSKFVTRILSTLEASHFLKIMHSSPMLTDIDIINRFSSRIDMLSWARVIFSELLS